MAESIASDACVRLIEYLGHFAAERISAYIGGRDKLNELLQTLELIRARLYDAEMRHEDKEGALIKTWLKGLKSVLYRLEDLLEEVVAADKQNEQRISGRYTKMACFLPSKLSSLKMNKTVAQEAEDIISELTRLKDNMSYLRLRETEMVDNLPAESLINEREETGSFIVKEVVVGRDEDKKVIVGMLLDSSHITETLSIVSIVGMGGLGKTSLAQLVYNDQRVQQSFELKCWLCLSNKISSYKELVTKITRSITRSYCPQSTMEELESMLREAVDAKKFLLVLDDTWDENFRRWYRLKSLLQGGKSGSKILVTCRSKVVAINMGAKEPFELKVLPEEKSWALFRRIFGEGWEKITPNMRSISREIIKKCGNVPLAIKTITGLLLSKDTEEEWVHFRYGGIGMIDQSDDDIMPTLKLSYDHLLPQQKQCFAYCSMFPKDYPIGIERLIWLWIAQGFVKSWDDGHACFMQLLRRCFFQNVTKSSDGKETCQIHDLMHDLAQMVGDECLAIDTPTETINNNIRHVWVNEPISPPLRTWKDPSWLLGSSQVGTYISSMDTGIITTSHLNEVFSYLKRLRVLDLGDSWYESLPNSIGKLKHLRYLRVCVNGLPRGITSLQNLQTLDLTGSYDLRELPRDLSKLTSLRNFMIRDFCMDVKLVDMPPKFGQLKHLERLDTFIVGENNGLDALSTLSLTGELGIFYKKHRQNATVEAMMANMKGKRLTSLLLSFDDEESCDGANELLKCLQPPPTLKFLTILRWKGIRFPSWGIRELPNLVALSIRDCTKCQQLPPFNGLPHLKILDIRNCEDLDLWDAKKDDDVDDDDDDYNHLGMANRVNSSTWPCLKSLQELCLWRVSKLKSLHSSIGTLSVLQQLNIIDFPNLETLPESIGQLSQLRSLSFICCPKLKSLPKSFRMLVALQQFKIMSCLLLASRCRKPDDEDWPLIQHIPCIYIDD